MNRNIMMILVMLFLIAPVSAAPDFFTADSIATGEVSQGFIPFAEGTHYAVGSGISTMSAHPLVFDWRDSGVVSSAKHQLNCGGCYGFASVGSLESVIAINDGVVHDLSENQAIKQNWEGLNLDGVGGCNGGNAEMVVNTWTQSGVMLEVDDPFTAGSEYNENGTLIYRVNEWKLLSTDEAPRLNTLKEYLMEYGPLYSTLNSTQMMMEDLEYDGTYALKSLNETLVSDHAVVIVGWDDTLNAWIVKNSWGSTWGDNGFGYVDYNSFGIGFYTSVVSGYEQYDSQTKVHALDEAGYNGALGATGFDHIQGLTIHEIGNESINTVEFWTTGETSDVDITIYDSFVSHKFGNLLYSVEDLHFDEPGYQSVNVGNVTSETGTAVLVINLLNLDCINYETRIAPVAVDLIGPGSKSKSFVAIGDETHKWYNQWYDLANLKMEDGTRLSFDIGHRLVTSSQVVYDHAQQPDYITDDDLRERVNGIMRQLDAYDDESVTSYEQMLEMLNGSAVRDGGSSVPDDYITVAEFDTVMSSIETRIAEMRVNSRSWIQRIFDKISELFD